MRCLLTVYVIAIVGSVDARVYCTNNNITYFMSTGYSCPITCANIIAAIESMKKSDYKALITRDGLIIRTRRPNRDQQMNSNLTWEDRRAKFKDGTRSNTIRRINAHNDVFDSLNFIAPAHIARMQKEIYRLPIFEKKDYCKKLLKVNKTELYRKCISRRFGKTNSYEAEFVRGMTKVLNQFAPAEYQFTTEMTAMLLRKIFGARVDLRQGVQVVSLIVNYFKKALKRSRLMARQRKTTIHLASRHCLTTQLTGCFCVKGYVEKDNLCVLPKHCIVPLGGVLDHQQAGYLSRIILE